MPSPATVTLLQQAVDAHGRGDLPAAEKLYTSILAAEPDQSDALALLGVLFTGKDNGKAVGLIEKAIHLDPHSALFRFYLGNALSTNETERALLAYQEATKLKPDFTEAYYNGALALEKLTRAAEALSYLQKTVALKPAHGDAWLVLCDLARKTGYYALACKAGEQAVHYLPGNLAAHVAYGMALEFFNREEDALPQFEAALKIKPDFIEVLDMLGLTYQNLNRLHEAEHTMRRTLELTGKAIPDEATRQVAEEDYSVQHWNLALLELLRGDFKNGFVHYRARFKKPGRGQRPLYPRPLWNSEDLTHKKILVVGEQGFGDTLMMCRYLPLLKAKGAHISFLLPDQLGPLFKNARYIDQLLHTEPASQEDYDYQTSLFDLPYHFGTTLATIPASIPYLPLPAPDENTHLDGDGRPKVGVVWGGRPDHGNDRRRSIPLKIFAHLFSEKNVQFFNMTAGLKAEEMALMAHNGVIDLVPKLKDFFATAKLMNQLDLVITCDTAVAHLAGGMGKKTWLLLPFAPDWRWLMEREDSPWYPTMRLFRQNIKADWAEVITRVRKELSAYHLRPKF